MIRSVRRLAGTTAVCVALGAALAACGSAQAPQAGRPAPARPAPAAKPPTLPAGPGGAAPVFFHGPRTRGKTVALTFDADMTADQGPRAAAGEHFDNPALIETLRRLKVPATIFMTGRWADQYPEQAHSLGGDPQFEVANHSFSHYAFTDDCYGLPTVSAANMKSDVQRAHTALLRAGVPHPMPYFRFPGGCYDQQALRAVGKLGVTAVQWDVVSGDAFATDADAVTKQVLDGVKPGSVVVMHCTRSAAPTTDEVVRTVVPQLRKQGYRFVKVSELIGETPGHR
ncbi:polysaccharide deacetylase family protein [Streptomyces sp. NPDC101234]|uniref:polysaccharide deacetylase family protein n=1 Tax=Streptomyces sp. NPDC101234 TaxID=3366138 RepID=UPI003824F6D9